MNEPGTKPSAGLSLEQLATEIKLLRDRVEDLEDARELDAAIRRNAAKPLIPWEEVRADLGLEASERTGD